MIELTNEQQASLKAEDPPRVLDTATGTTYVLVKEKAYERMKHILTDGDDIRRYYPVLADLSPEDWEDGVNYPAGTCVSAGRRQTAPALSILHRER